MTAEEICTTTRFNRKDAEIIALAASQDSRLEPFAWAMIKSGLYDAADIHVRLHLLRHVLR